MQINSRWIRPLVLSLLAADSVAQVQVRCLTTHRRTAWTNCFDPGKRKIHGHLQLEYGSPIWKPEYAGLKGYSGRRLRLGSGKFASFRVGLPLVSGDLRVGLGTYSLALDCDKKGRWSLALMSPEMLSEKKIQAYRSDRSKGMGQLLVLTHTISNVVEPRLSIDFEPVEERPAEVRLLVRWGPHVFTAPIALQTERPKRPAGHEKK